MHLGHEKEGTAGKQRTLASELRFLAESIHCLYVCLGNSKSNQIFVSLKELFFIRLK